MFLRLDVKLIYTLLFLAWYIVYVFQLASLLFSSLGPPFASINDLRLHLKINFFYVLWSANLLFPIFIFVEVLIFSPGCWTISTYLLHLNGDIMRWVPLLIFAGGL